jgi:hypothetical protein
MAVKTIHQRIVAGMKKGRLQFPALFAESLFGATFSLKGMAEKILYLKLRFMAFNIINVYTGKVNIRRRVKAFIWCLIYFSLSE